MRPNMFAKGLSVSMMVVAVAGIFGCTAPDAPPANPGTVSMPVDGNASLPPASTLEQMQVGEEFWTASHALTVSDDYKAYLDLGYPTGASSFGARNLQVIRQADGYHVWPAANQRWTILVNPGTQVGLHKLVPVIFHGNATGASVTVPEAFIEKTLSRMAVGDKGYVMPHILIEDEAGAHWLNPDALYAKTPAGTLTMLVERRADGYYVSRKETESAMGVWRAGLTYIPVKKVEMTG